MPYVVFLNEDRTPTTFELAKDRTTLGRKPDNDVVIDIKGVSRYHAQIQREGDRYIIEDLGSTNYLFVGGQQVQKGVLTHGTRFALGDYALGLFLEREDRAEVASFLKSQEQGANLDSTTRIFTRAMPKTVKELEALIEVGAHINTMLELDLVLESIIQKVLELMRAERGFIMLEEDGQLVPVIAKNMESDLIDEERLSFSRSFSRKAIEKGETILSTNVAEDPRYTSESIISHNILSIMCAPLRVKEKIIGCLYIDIRETSRHFSARDASFFTALANQASIAIENARLTQNLKKHQIELEHSNQQLANSLERLVEAKHALERKHAEQSALFEVSKALNMAQDMDSMLSSILSSARKVLGAQRGSLMLMSERLGGLVVKLVDGVDRIDANRTILKLGEGIAGIVAQTGEGRVVNQGSQDRDFQHRLKRDSDIRQMICAPLMADGKCIGVINLINNTRDSPFEKGHLDLLTSIANLAAVAFEKFRLYTERLEQEKLNLELEDARKVQQLLLPRRMPRFAHFEFSAKYALANRVGGDYYDFIPLDDTRLAVVIADVSGHDIASAIVMAMGRNMVRTLFGQGLKASQIMARTSQILRQDTQSSRYITMFLGVLDSRKMTMTYCNAGHNYPLYLASKSEKFDSLATGGFPLGLVDDDTYQEETIELSPGDLLILYTDGLIEAQAPSGDMFELDRLESTILSHRNEPVEKLCDTLYEKALDFTEQEKLQDDFTFLAIRVKDPPSELHLSLRGSRDSIPPTVEQVLQFVQKSPFPSLDRFNLRMVLQEALTNAVLHGTGERPELSVHVSVIPSTEHLLIVVRDEGKGYHVEATLQRQRRDASGSHGRGLQLLREYADEIEFNDQGNEIALTFHNR